MNESELMYIVGICEVRAKFGIKVNKTTPTTTTPVITIVLSDTSIAEYLIKYLGGGYIELNGPWTTIRLSAQEVVKNFMNRIAPLFKFQENKQQIDIMNEFIEATENKDNAKRLEIAKKMRELVNENKLQLGRYKH